MKLYMHPVSMTSRPVRLFIAESGIPVEEEIVDLFTGAHYKEPFSSINPNRMVPVLEDGDLRLTESSAILKYLADKIDSPLYPKGLQQRARVNERMDWFNTQLSRDFCFGLAFAQLLPHHSFGLHCLTLLPLLAVVLRPQPLTHLAQQFPLQSILPEKPTPPNRFVACGLLRASHASICRSDSCRRTAL